MRKRISFLFVVCALGTLAAAEPFAEALKVLTFNAGLLRLFGSDTVPNVEARGKVLPASLAALADEESLSIIMLEEVWEDSHARAVSDALAPLGYQTVRPKERTWIGMGSGLLLAVRAPLRVLEWKFTPFDHSTFIDSFARKGVLQAVLEDPAGARFVVLGTHTVALDTKGGRSSDPAQLAAFRVQAGKILAALGASTEHGKLPAVLLGDFNVGPGYVQDGYDLIAEAPGISEAGASAGGETPIVTWDPENPEVKYGEYPNEPAAKIDQVFVKDGGSQGWTVLSALRVFDAPVAGLRLTPRGSSASVETPLSDHYGLLAELELTERR